MTNARIVILLAALCLVFLSACDQYTPAEENPTVGSPAPAKRELPSATARQAAAIPTGGQIAPTAAIDQATPAPIVQPANSISVAEPTADTAASEPPKSTTPPEIFTPTLTAEFSVAAAALEPPSVTVNSEPPTATATATRPPPTLAPTATSTPAPPTRDPNCPKAIFVADVSVPDDTWMAPGQAFVKTWRVQNAGNCPWSPGSHVAYWSGDNLGTPTGATVVGGLKVGQTTDVSLRMIAPSIDGPYEGAWAIFDDNGRIFGPLLTVVIQVGVPTPEPPPPTATPEPATPTATASPTTPTAAPSHPGAVQEGPASYYSPSLDGAGTASGEIYRNDLLTAAHRTLPFGTRVRVTNLRNGKSVEVVVNDRGPFSRILVIDLSYRAAQELEMISAGIVNARIEVLE